VSVDGEAAYLRGADRDQVLVRNGMTSGIGEKDQQRACGKEEGQPSPRDAPGWGGTRQGKSFPTRVARKARASAEANGGGQTGTRIAPRPARRRREKKGGERGSAEHEVGGESPS